MCDTKQIYLQLDNFQQCRFSTIEKIEDFILEISDGEKMSIIISKYITVLEFDKNIIMSRTSFRVNPHCSLPECQGTPYSKQASYLFSFTVVGTLVGIVSASISC